MAEASRPWRHGGAGLLVMLRLTPGSSRDAVEGVEPAQGGSVIRARVRAKPDKGKANAAACKLLARWLGLPPSRVSLRSGGSSRLKTFEIAGDAAALEATLAERLRGITEETR
ncbi:MAG: DUF167 domain-containing protein [Hyphomicrobiales bacterium]